MKKLIFLLLIVLLSTITHAMLFHNDIIPAFPPEDRPKIESAVIDGAVHFFQAQSHASLLMMEYERSSKLPFDYSAALTHTLNAFSELEKSVEDYGQAVNMGIQAGYYSETIAKFKAFNYDNFSLANFMNRDTMVTVKAYFSVGNIVGVYQQNVDSLNDILVTLVMVKDKLEAGKMPEKFLLWQLFQQFSQAALFGNYCTVTAENVLAK